MTDALDLVRGLWQKEAKKKSAEIGDLYIQSSSGHCILLDDGKIEETSSSSSSGIGARFIIGDKTLYAARSGTDGNSLNGALQDLGGLGGWSFPSLSADSEFLPVPQVQVPSLHGILKDLDKAVRKKDPRVSQVSISLGTSEKSVIIIREDGRLLRDSQRFSIYRINVVMEDRGEIQTGTQVAASRSSLEELARENDFQDMAFHAMETAGLMLEARQCPAGAMPVIIAGEAGGTIIHEACGHGMEADIVQREFSVYRNLLGQAVASPQVTVVDDGSMSSLYGGYSMDDEGTPSRRNVLIEKGILRSYLTDRETALRFGLPPTGNGRRSSYKVPPQPRMSNTFVEPGDQNLDQMIRSITKGLLVKDMGGGEVNPTSGDFVFHVTEGYVIKKGELIPVKGAVLTGNGPETLKKIVGVGKDLKFIPGLCEKGGQDVPVTDGQPALLIDGITVGGSSTDL